ncbi:MAG: MarR family transcriptional regulator [Chloroflexota bacterium]|nr:MarR family transcriptional regulator [Chloroflexota bacterium]
MSEYFPGSDRSQLTEQLVDLFEQINRAMHCTPSDGWEGLDLTFQQVRVLALLFEGQQRMGNIASYMGCIVSSATNIVDRLVDKGLVIRSIDPEDRRAVVCRLTDQGKETMERFWSIGREKIITLADQLEASELAEVVRAAVLMNQAASIAFPAGYSQPDS